MRPVPRPIAAARPAAAAVDVRVAVVDAPAVVDVPEVVVGVTIIRAMRVSLESRAGKEQHSVVHCRVLRNAIWQKNVPWRCLCLVEAVPASPSVRKSAHGRKNRKKRPSVKSSESRKSRQLDPTNLPLKTSRRRPSNGPYPVSPIWTSRHNIFDSDASKGAAPEAAL